MSAILNLKYFNSFWLKKMKSVVAYDPAAGDPVNGPLNQSTLPGNFASDATEDWYIEEARIKGGYNNTSVDFGVKAYLVEEESEQQHRFNSVIYSGVFNSRTGVNRTNVFSVAEDITKSADPANGSIQKLYAEDTNLIILQEDKVSRALIDKDAIYSAEGNTSLTSSNLVIGQILPFTGNYGISTDPESFAVYGYRKYFTDRKRNAVLRLSRDGLTEISSYGMRDFFRDSISSLVASDKIIGGWDIHNKNYVVSIQKGSTNFSTLSFDEEARGWTSFFSYKPGHLLSLDASFYSTNSGEIWQHYAFDSNFETQRGVFYGSQNNSNVSFVFNNEQSSIKIFKTINYEGDSGWEVESITTNSDTGLRINKAVDTVAELSTLVDMQAQLFHNNFKRKENKYFASISNNSVPEPGQIIFGSSDSGIKGFFATVNMSIDNSSGGKKELFAVSTNYTESSY
tara:strand:+ start:625 stop:1989 length:1365 start_codon:yes stop_codon:yes gene_type:complete